MGKYEEDCRARKIAYAAACPWMGENSVTLYEFDPLEFDPDPEEITRNLYKEAIDFRKNLQWKIEKQI